MSSASYASERADVVLMAITSQIRPTPGFGDVWLSHWNSAGLIKPSVVKPVIATLEQGLVIRSLGALAVEDAAALRTALGQILG